MVVTCRLGIGQPLHLVDDANAEDSHSVLVLGPLTEPEVFAEPLRAGHVAAVVSVRVMGAMLLACNGRHHHIFGITIFKSNVLLVHSFVTTHVSQYTVVCAPRHSRHHRMWDWSALKPCSFPYFSASMDDQPAGALYVLEQLNVMQHIHNMNEYDTGDRRTSPRTRRILRAGRLDAGS